MKTDNTLDVGDLWRRYGDEMVRYARTRLAGISRAGEDAEDVVQEALLSLHRRPPSTVRNPRNLFYAAVFFKCATLISSNRGQQQPVDPQSWRMRQRRAIQRGDLDAAILVHTALSELCQRERAVAIHRLMYGQTAREVGLMLGLDRNRVTAIAAQVAEELRINLAILDDGDRLTADEVAARRRRLLFEAADQIGVAAACRQFGVSTSSFHNWRNEGQAA